MVARAEQAAAEAEMDRLRRQQKQLVGAISELSGVPEGSTPSVLKTFLREDTKR